MSQQAPDIITLDESPSTNDHAKQLARQGAAAFTVVRAHHQTAGRGRLGNGWVSYPGNLYMSVILRPDQLAAAESGQLSFLAAVALAETLETYGGDVRLKWPNDVLRNGGKVAGILLETEAAGGIVPWIVIGIGVNVAASPQTAADLSGTGATADGVMNDLLPRLSGLYEQWRARGFGAIRERWLARASGVGGAIRVRLPSETLDAVFDGIDDRGALQITLADGGKRVVHSGEVFAA